MEEDTGKLTHLGSDTGRIEGATASLLDFNRAGVPLIEIVTKPIEGTGERAPEIARAYVTALRDLLRGLGVSDVRMDQGSMRCDSNVSLRLIGAEEFGTRTETKNVNSLKSVEVAVRYEMRRQAAVLQSGGRIIQETRHFQRGRLHHGGAQQGNGAGLPVLPRARSGARCSERRVRRKAPRDHPRASVVAAQSDSAGLGNLRRGHARPRQQRRDRSGHGNRRGRGNERSRPRLVGQLPGAEGQREPGVGRWTCRSRRNRLPPCMKLDRRGQAVQQAGPPGDRGRARR